MANCRICLEKDTKLNSLFNLVENKYLPAVVYNISGVKILRKLDPGAKICTKCEHAVLLAEKIILRCQESEEYIRSERLRKNGTDSQTQQSQLKIEQLNDDSNSVATEDAPVTCTNGTANHEKEKSKDKLILQCQKSEECTQSERFKKNETDTQTEQSQLKNEQQNGNSNAVITEDAPVIYTNGTANQEKGKSKDGRSKKPRTYDLHCDHCDFGCKTARALVKHRKEIHQINDDNIFPCGMCEKRFPWKSALNRHIQNYHKSLPEEKKFLCIECGNIYISQKHLIEHQNQRHGPRRFRCVEPNCKQTFTRAFTLRRHFFTTHHNISSYYCNDCNESFKVYDHWKYHNKIVHNNQKRDYHTYKKND